MISNPAIGVVIAAALVLAAQPAPDTAQDGAKSSPPKVAPPTPPKPDVDPKMAVTPSDPPAAAKKPDETVKPVAPAPSEPDKPGVRKL